MLLEKRQMPFLSEADQDQLKTIFAEQLDRRIRLPVLTKSSSKLYIPGQQLCASCAEAEPFVRELTTLSDKLDGASMSWRPQDRCQRCAGARRCSARSSADGRDPRRDPATRRVILPCLREHSHPSGATALAPRSISHTTRPSSAPAQPSRSRVSAS